MMSERLLCTSWRMVESLRFNSSISATVNVTGCVGKPIPHSDLNNGPKQDWKYRLQTGTRLLCRFAIKFYAMMKRAEGAFRWRLESRQNPQTGMSALHTRLTLRTF